MASKEPSRYVGPFEAKLPDGTLCVPGETVVDIGKGEAEQSDNWQPVKSASKSSDRGGEQ